MSGAAGISAANHLYNLAKRDGLTVMAMGRANYLEQMTGKPEVRFDFRKFSWVGSFNNAPMMLACRADRGLTAGKNSRLKDAAAIRTRRQRQREHNLQ